MLLRNRLTRKLYKQWLHLYHEHKTHKEFEKPFITIDEEQLDRLRKENEKLMEKELEALFEDGIHNAIAPNITVPTELLDRLRDGEEEESLRKAIPNRQTDTIPEKILDWFRDEEEKESFRKSIIRNPNSSMDMLMWCRKKKEEEECFRKTVIPSNKK